MSGWRKSKGSKHLPRASSPVSDPNVARDPTRGRASGQPSPGLQPEQPLGENTPQQATLSPPDEGFGSRLFNKFRRKSLSRSPSPGVAPHHNITNQSIAGGSTQLTITASAPQSLTVPASTSTRPHTSDSAIPIVQTHITAVPSSGNVSNTQGSSSAGVPIVRVHPQSEPIPNADSSTDSTLAPQIPTSSSQAQSQAKSIMHTAVQPQTGLTPGPGDTGPSSRSDRVWDRALEIAKKKLIDNNLPPLNLTNLTSKSAEEHIQAVVEALNTLTEDEKKIRWKYTWRGTEIIFVEHLGKILKRIEKYSMIANIAIQSNPKVSALVWASVWAIMQVRILKYPSLDTDSLKLT